MLDELASWLNAAKAKNEVTSLAFAIARVGDLEMEKPVGEVIAKLMVAASILAISHCCARWSTDGIWYTRRPD